MKKLLAAVGATGLLSITLTGLGGCNRAAPGNESAASPAPAAATSATPAKLPISINAVMVGVVDHASDYLFAIGNGDMPKNDHDWALVRDHAYQMVVAGQASKMAGTGENDVRWVTDPRWQNMADKLTEIGVQAVKLADAKETKGWEQLGNDLVDDCLACHEAFKPDTPSQKILHEVTKREASGKSIFAPE